MRVFVPVTGSELAALGAAGRLDPPRAAHTVTAALRADWPGAEEEEREYAALMAAAYDSLVLLAAASDERYRRRTVLAVELSQEVVRPAGSEELTAVLVTGAIALDQVAAVHVDDAAAEPDVQRAVEAVPAAGAGEPAALVTVALEDHELLWYARQEIPDLLA